MDQDDTARLTAALRTVCAELDALSQGVHAPDTGAAPGTERSPRDMRYREAVRDAIQALERSRKSFNSDELCALQRAMESLLLEGPR